VIAQQGAFDGGTTPRWGYQTSFWQRRRPAFWLFVITLVITGLDFLAQQMQMIAAVPAAWFTTVILLVPYALPVVAIIYFLDLYEHEPISILAAAVLWGGIAATTLSMYTNTPLMELIFKVTGDPTFTQSWSAALTAPFVEEGFKAMGVILLIAIARPELDDVLDGFVWGAMVGIGFLLVEDVFYFVRAFAETGTYDTLFGMFMIRILGAGPYSHFLYTGLVGMGIAYYTTRTDQTWSRRLGIGLLLAAAGVAAHFFWNSPIFSGLADEGGLFGWAAYVTVKGLPMLIGLILVVRMARQKERVWFRAFSQTFFDDGAITEAELEELGGLRARRRARKAAGRAKGRAGAKLKGQIQRQQINLAMVMSRYGSEQHPEVARQQQFVLGMKAQLAAMGTAPAMAAAPAWGQPASSAPAQAAPAQVAPVQAAPAGWGQPAQVAQPAPVQVAPAAQPAPVTWGQPAPQPVAQAAPTQVAPVMWGQQATQPVAQAQVAQPAVAPGPAPTPAPPPVWTPTHLAPDEGLPAWATPDPSQAPIVSLAGRLELVIAERAGDWARVTAVNGWTGWVDARRLVPRT
jgi:RsiW-degrading membrane proteinase PrsW (M82 family)